MRLRLGIGHNAGALRKIPANCELGFQSVVWSAARRVRDSLTSFADARLPGRVRSDRYGLQAYTTMRR
jgi:hypothetical protein